MTTPYTPTYPPDGSVFDPERLDPPQNSQAMTGWQAAEKHGCPCLNPPPAPTSDQSAE